MENVELNQLFHEYGVSVIQRLLSDDYLSAFPDCSAFLSKNFKNIPPWQMALPVISCLAAGGEIETGYTASAAWYPLCLATEILDSIEDNEYLPDPLAPSPEIATNLATSFILLSLHIYTSVQDAAAIRRVVRIFSKLGFDTTIGQHRDLAKIPAPVDKTLNDNWEITILKSGSVFRMGTAGGAALATSDENIIKALGDYGTALGMMLQLIDDCRDAFTLSQDAMHWEISLPLLVYLMTIGKEELIYPEVSSKAQWSNLLREKGVIHVISSLLLEWRNLALESLKPLSMSNERLILESIPSLILERAPMSSEEA
jgi:hypothetical protein